MACARGPDSLEARAGRDRLRDPLRRHPPVEVVPDDDEHRRRARVLHVPLQPRLHDADPVACAGDPRRQQDGAADERPSARVVRPLESGVHESEHAADHRYEHADRHRLRPVGQDEARTPVPPHARLRVEPGGPGRHGRHRRRLAALSRLRVHGQPLRQPHLHGLGRRVAGVGAAHSRRTDPAAGEHEGADCGQGRQVPGCGLGGGRDRSGGIDRRRRGRGLLQGKRRLRRRERGELVACVFHDRAAGRERRPLGFGLADRALLLDGRAGDDLLDERRSGGDRSQARLPGRRGAAGRVRGRKHDGLRQGVAPGGDDGREAVRVRCRADRSHGRSGRSARGGLRLADRRVAARRRCDDLPGRALAHALPVAHGQAGDDACDLPRAAADQVQRRHVVLPRARDQPGAAGGRSCDDVVADRADQDHRRPVHDRQAAAAGAAAPRGGR